MIVFFFFLLSTTIICSSQINNRPIIGILTQPSGDSIKVYGGSYIAASYVKFIESAGARVVPIPYNATKEEITHLFNSINAAFFPGGGSDIHGTPLFNTAKLIVELAIKAYDQEDYFPVFGHCLGFEMILTIISGDLNVLDPTDAENISMALDLLQGFQNTRFFKNAPENVVTSLTNKNNPVTLNNHYWGIYTEHWNKVQKLKNFFKVISTNKDKKGKEFVSTIEGNVYPIYGLQWHAEKPQFEWYSNEDINHTYDSIISMQYMAQFYVNEARQNNHKFSSSREESQKLIYNYTPLYTAHIIPDFQQCYMFK